MSLPKPYPDELVGSVLARAVIHLGLRPKRLLSKVVDGARRSMYSMFLPGDLPQLAPKLRMDAQQLLWEHTTFPFSVAFMPKTEVQRLEAKALEGCSDGSTSMASLVKSVTHSLPRFKYCTACAARDVQTYGESYWHRNHCLPAVQYCPEHGIPLRGSDIQPRTFAQHLLMELPQRQKGIPEKIAQSEVSRLIVEAISAICSRNWQHRSDWLHEYRGRAQAQGFTLPNGSLAGSRLAFELRSTLRAEQLAALGCNYSHLERAWPALMVRPEIRIPFSPVKHLVLSAYLQSYAPSGLVFSYRRPGKHPRDLESLDRSLSTEIQLLAAKALIKGEVTTMKHLLEATGNWHVFRHKRELLPLTVAQLIRFQASDASERKKGGREAHAKRMLAIAEGRQKPMKNNYRSRQKALSQP